MLITPSIFETSVFGLDRSQVRFSSMSNWVFLQARLLSELVERLPLVDPFGYRLVDLDAN
jgi:hypothetical protein